MMTTRIPNIDIDACPLCQHDEFFISQNGEKFFCAQCGFHTHQLQQIQQQVLLSKPAVTLAATYLPHQLHPLTQTQH
ncbi:hypothetical protein M6B40_000653 [Vibrio metschnikovii]|uniref:hypothetical protein n=1 Tax=Vibrio TaxID=662 RepID=UPI000932F6B4|nr:MULTISPECIES: hypothetical protein [Vibrio]EKO3575002.1 hypothetical protein [Vibrio metschnikovii]EKO3598512.1 hypothetical protein [Vibrio metschnikovii]EKO3710963.1 hypothetical protein [Vibrio metschnikovii]EKO3900269.1 hypothetical protein [Vibrio metschnikovii]NAW77488.1 hypothetical protein [Vibrio sp. V33_P6A3T137]